MLSIGVLTDNTEFSKEQASCQIQCYYVLPKSDFYTATSPDGIPM
jgi:hypothetical protein